MKREEWAAARHSYKLSQRDWKPGVKLPVPSWLPIWASDRIYISCQSCQDYMDIPYGSAECTVCPLANFVDRLCLIDGHHLF